MKGGKTPLKTKGYTIVEVMIVLAVSGMMFLMAATFINGKQQKTAFTQGSNELGSRIQKVIDEVTDGHYSDVPLSCTIGGSNRANASYAASAEQGTNSSCVFLGKLVHFYKSGTTMPENYEVISLADNIESNDTDDPIPRNSIGRIGDLTIQKTTPQSLMVESMKVEVIRPATGGVESKTGIYNIGFIQSSGEIADPVNGTYKSGAQTIRMIASQQTTDAAPAPAAAFMTYLWSAKSAQICLTDGQRYARVLIGSENNSNELSVKVKQLGETAC